MSFFFYLKKRIAFVPEKIGRNRVILMFPSTCDSRCIAFTFRVCLYLFSKTFKGRAEHFSWLLINTDNPRITWALRKIRMTPFSLVRKTQLKPDAGIGKKKNTWLSFLSYFVTLWVILYFEDLHAFNLNFLAHIYMFFPHGVIFFMKRISPFCSKTPPHNMLLSPLVIMAE